MNYMYRLCMLIGALFFLGACQTPLQEVDLLVINARVYTLDSNFSVQQAMVVDDGRVLITGDTETLRKTYKARQLLDLRGAFVYPGFNDAHAHFAAYSKTSNSVDLVGSRSFEEVLQRTLDFVGGRKLDFIQGRGWDQTKWPGRRWPSKEKLDSLFPHTPVLLRRIDGHAAVANSAALAYAQITADTKVSGGVIQLKEGEPTGLLIDNAVDLVRFPPPGRANFLAALRETQEEAFSYGITSLTEAGLVQQDIERLRDFYADSSLMVRLNVMLADDSATLAHYLSNGPIHSPSLRVHSVKFYIDGALGSRGALLLNDYSDEAGNRGLQLSSTAHFQRWADSLAALGWQMCSHAIGDSANRLVVEVYRRATAQMEDHRWRIEHAQIVHPSDQQKMLAAGIIPSIQPTHATSDMYWAEERLGPQRITYAYPARDFLAAKGTAVLPLGTDFPVESLNPMYTLRAALFRTDGDGQFFVQSGNEQQLSFEQALRGMTHWPAYAAFEENHKGRLLPGMWADFVVFEEDLSVATAQELGQLVPLYTYLAGRRVYKRAL